MKLKKPLFDIFITASTLVTLLVSGTGVLLPQSVESVAHFSWTNIQTSITRGLYYFSFFNNHHLSICMCTFPNNQIFRQRNLTILLIVKWHTQIYTNMGVYLTSNLLWLLFSLLLHGITKELYASSTTYPLLRAKHISNSLIYGSLCAKKWEANNIDWSVLSRTYYCWFCAIISMDIFVPFISYSIKRWFVYNT